MQDALFASAQRTRTSYEDVATLYTRVARNADALGKSQAELLRFTELVSMQLQISGASASEIAMVRGLLAHNIVAADLSEAQMDDVWAWAGAGLNTFDLVTLWRRAA